jgi:hypothetical protein
MPGPIEGIAFKSPIDLQMTDERKEEWPSHDQNSPYISGLPRLSDPAQPREVASFTINFELEF